MQTALLLTVESIILPPVPSVSLLFPHPPSVEQIELDHNWITQRNDDDMPLAVERFYGTSISHTGLPEVHTHTTICRIHFLV